MTSGGASAQIISAGSPERRSTTKAKVTTRTIVSAARRCEWRNSAPSGRVPRFDLRPRHEMAGDLPVAADGASSAGVSVAAARDRARAARMEGAAGGPRRRVGRIARQHDAARAAAPGAGDAETSACVYGCSGAQTDRRRSPISTMRPRYITATSWLTCRTTRRSWLMNSMRQPELVPGDRRAGSPPGPGSRRRAR